MKKVKQVLNILTYNLKPLVIFELIYKLLSLMIFTPLFLKSFTFIMKLTGFKYLTIENIGSFLLNPLTILMLIILLLLMTLYTMFDITTIIIILDSSYHKQKIKVSDAVLMSLNKGKKVFKFQNISLAFLVLFLIPFLNIGLSSSFISTVKIPEFIIDFIFHNQILLGAFLVLVVLLTILLLRWLYSLHYFVIEDVSFKEARARSCKLSLKSHLKDLLTLLLIQFVITIIFLLFIGLGIVMIVLFNKIFNLLVLKSLVSTIIWIFIALSIVVMTTLSTPISYATISVMYYFHKLEKNEAILKLQVKSKERKKKKTTKLKYALILLSFTAFLFAFLFTYQVYKGKYNLNIEYVRTLEVTAHRGASSLYPENTMSAFIGAKELGADFIELDVQETKDREIIVSHDTNLQRVTGVNKEIIDMNYDEIKNLDAGSFFDKKYRDERIPLLDEVLKWARENNMKLNIELKPTGREVDFEKLVIDIIKKYQYEDNCVLTSQVYSVLERAKQYDSKIKTVYVMSLAVGDIVLLSKADNFSIEASNVNQSIVSKVHKEGKQLYVWTVNTSDNIKKMIDYKVDNIITDDITLAKDTIYASKTSNLISEFIKIVQKVL